MTNYYATALDYLRENGWMKGGVKKLDDNCTCVGGALAYAVMGDVDKLYSMTKSEELINTLREFAEHVAGEVDVYYITENPNGIDIPVFQWNDEEDRVWPDVEQALVELAGEAAR